MLQNQGGATEIKFLVSPATGEAVRKWARNALAPDPHGSGTFSDCYDTTSIYFDTGAFDTFHRRRSFARTKYRIRRYGESQVVFLERKLKQRGLVSKRRAVIPIDEIGRVNTIHADGAAVADWEGSWFSRRLALRGLQPVCQISYRRTARMATTGNGPMRLTIDECVRASETSATAFANAPGIAVADHAIVELKFHFEIPAIFRMLVQEFMLVQAPVSKYRLAAAQLGLATENEGTCRTF